MSQQAAVTLNTVVYDPAGQDSASKLVLWFNRAGGILNSFSRLTQRFRQGIGAAKASEISFRLEVPVVATSDTTCSCAGALLRTGYAQVTFTFAESSTTAERTDLYLRLKDLVATDLVKNGVEGPDPAYA